MSFRSGIASVMLALLVGYIVTASRCNGSGLIQRADKTCLCGVVAAMLPLSVKVDITGDDCTRLDDNNEILMILHHSLPSRSANEIPVSITNKKLSTR